MKRKIIHIDEEKCTGCGQCIPDCPEGALQLIEGKARLVSDLFCDGLGACMGACPEVAITVIEREAGAYDEKAVMANIVLQGSAVITAHLEHLIRHGQDGLYTQALEYLNEHHIPVPRHHIPGSQPDRIAEGHRSFPGCPGSAAYSISRKASAGCDQSSGISGSELRQWPVQLKLVDPRAPYFANSDLLITADCVPVAYGDFHRDFLKGKIVIMFCPKLDADIKGYLIKLSELFSHHTLHSVTTIHMEVPCCTGIPHLVKQAIERSRKTIPLKDITISVDGHIA